MDSLEPQTHGAASAADSLNPTTHKRPGARPHAHRAPEAAWIVMTPSSAPDDAPTGGEASWTRAQRARSSAPRRHQRPRLSPTWQPRAGTSLTSFHPWENPLYPRIPKAPRLPSEFDGMTPASPSLAPQLFESGGLDLLESEPSMWPAVRRVWTWLRGGSR